MKNDYNYSPVVESWLKVAENIRKPIHLNLRPNAQDRIADDYGKQANINLQLYTNYRPKRTTSSKRTTAHSIQGHERMVLSR